jgi:hypothetical protein
VLGHVSEQAGVMSDRAQPSSGESLAAPVTPASPLPWQVIDGAVYDAESQSAPFTNLEGVHYPDFRTGLVALVYDKSRIHQIAAAPELLAALKGFVSEFNGGEYDHGFWPLMDRAIAAIAKAETTSHA